MPHNEEDCARPSSFTSGSSGSAPPGCRGAIHPSSVRARRSTGCATRSALRFRGAPAGRRRGGSRRAALLGHLVDYHQRERARSGGRGSVGRSSTTTSSLPTRTAIGRIVRDGRPPESRIRATRTGSRSRNGSTSSTARSSTRTIPSAVPAAGRRRPRARDAAALHEARGGAASARAHPGAPYGDDVKREALMQFGRAPTRTATSAGTRRSPRSSRRRPDVDLGGDPVAAAMSLREGCLFVQGPPGSGRRGRARGWRSR